MNERIRELRNQAWKEAYNVDPDNPNIVRAHSYMEEGMEKFAELIVRECASVDLYWLSEQDRKAIAEKIKEHFGVD
jgi:hypothetical protein